ncbi:uncharacterized protein LOC103717482 isoform X1 [Phoenix dactylifera]|uniref:Uncharacterized protein LOC103717482 isoform X1 n=2 Tax=Phoenix dactylifera TaxID=42345 RepID=A0A8B7CQC7_PHODC|nr:uncharacterized protein LOC103717482 isoform X1 [Phoenix dactylifera]
MPARCRIAFWALAASLLCFEPVLSLAGGACELSVRRRNLVYNYSLASSTSKHPHGVLSEDGFYKVAVNETLLWFQLCDQMIFNHNPPRCFGCQDCGGPSHCGMKCSALVANNIGGYHVCTTIGGLPNQNIALIDENDPERGVIIRMSANSLEKNCSLSVSVFCDSVKTHVPNSLNISGSCDYATVLRHPSGCAKVISVNGNGLGWFGTLIIIILCLVGGYILIGTIYRFFFLGIHGAEAIPNMEFWFSLPQRARSMLGSLVRRFRGHTRDSRGSYAPMNH